MNILLFSDIPPCHTLSGGIFLDKLVAFLPEGSVSAFIVQHPGLNPSLPKNLSWMEVQTVRKPPEDWGLRKLGAARSLVMETAAPFLTHSKIIAQAARFARSVGAEAIWAPLQGQTMIRLARPLAERTGLPLYPQVFDPPGWWLRENRVHPWIQAQVMAEFGRVLKHGKCSALSSWNMADAYRARYGIDAVPLVAGLEKSLALQAASEPHARDEFVITMAGQVYSSQEWNALLAALQSVEWKIAGKAVKVRLLGPKTPISTPGDAAPVEFLGWRPQAETMQIFANSDVLYCPYWFDPAFAEEARLSFPSKLSTYLASGRPVLFHGPEYASPAAFLRQNDAGALCLSLEPGEIIARLEQLATDPAYYARLAENGLRAFHRYLTEDCMRASFTRFLLEH